MSVLASAATPGVGPASRVHGSDEFLSLVRADAASDRQYKVKLKALERGTSAFADFVLVDGLLYYAPVPSVPPRLYVPKGAAREWVLREAHDVPSAGHLGRNKMYERVSRCYYWPGLYSAVDAWYQV
jgi:hypothetical protein